MKKILFGIFLVISALPAHGLTISGTVYGDDAPNEPLIAVTVQVEGTSKGTVTDENGAYTLENVNEGEKIKFSYVGYAPQTILAKASMGKTILKATSTNIEEVEVTACSTKATEALNATTAKYIAGACRATQCKPSFKAVQKTITPEDEDDDPITYYECIDTNGMACDPMPANASVAKIENGKCIIKKCNEPQYKLINNECVDQVGTDCTEKIKNAKSAKYEMDGGKLVCRVETCNEPGWVANETRTKCDASDGPCPDNLLKQLEHATAGQMRKGQCVATACEDDYEVKKGKCVLKSGGCKPSQENAKSGKYETRDGKLVCVITKCNKGYLPNSDGTACDVSEGPCTTAQIAAVPKATAGKMKRGECFITECDKGWHVSKDKKKCEQAELSEADSKAKVDELKDNAQKMKDKEQSTANKLLGAAAIGATGIGAMNLASGLAEKSADQSAEEDMKAYLATFTCDYGQGRNIKGGERNIDLPGGNDLFAAANEYRALAADLKIRKEALGKQPGIESEVIIDAADTGLYDNVGLGRQSGAYTSLSRALTDETSKDAEEWAKQKADTQSKIKTAAITVGVATVGAIAGNLAINSGDKNKNKVNEINKKYEGLKQPLQKLENDVQQIPPSPAPTTCPAGATGTYPNCNCGANAVYTSENTCAACGVNEVPDTDGKTCVCRNGYAGNPCTKIQPQITPKCTLTDENRSNVNVDSNGNCTCVNAFPDVPTCACNPETHVYSGGVCTKKVTTEELTITLPAASLFDTNKYDLKPAAQTALNEFINSFNAWALAQNPNTPHCIEINGYTDRTGNDNINKTLSKNRANAVNNHLTGNGINTTQITANGYGPGTCPNNPKNNPDCRKVEIKFHKTNCDGSGAAATPTAETVVTNLVGTATGKASSTGTPFDGNDPDAANPELLKQLAASCNNYSQNGVRGYFVVNPKSFTPLIGGNNNKDSMKIAYCIFYKNANGQTISSTNIGGTYQYTGPAFTISNASFAVSEDATRCKFGSTDYNSYTKNVSFNQATNNKAGCEYSYIVKQDSAAAEYEPLTATEMRSKFSSIAEKCESYSKNGEKGIFAVENIIDERGYQRFVCLFVKPAQNGDPSGKNDPQIAQIGTQMESLDQINAEKEILMAAAQDGYVYSRDASGTRCKQVFSGEKSWRGQFPDSHYYGCRFIYT